MGDSLSHLDDLLKRQKKKDLKYYSSICNTSRLRLRRINTTAFFCRSVACNIVIYFEEALKSGPNYNTKTLSEMFLNPLLTRNQWGLRFADKTLAITLCSLSADAK